MDILKKERNQVLLTILIGVACFLIFAYSGVLDNGGMAVVVILWIPLVILIATLIIYAIVRYFTKKYTWIVLALGTTLNVVMVANALLTGLG